MPGTYEYTRVQALRVSDERAGRHPRPHDAVGRLEARRVAGHRRDEVVPFDRVERQVGRRAHGRRTRDVAQERDLAEEVSAAETPGLAAVDLDDRLARRDGV